MILDNLVMLIYSGEREVICNIHDTYWMVIKSTYNYSRIPNIASKNLMKNYKIQVMAEDHILYS